MKNEKLKYTIIKDINQYNDYSNHYENLFDSIVSAGKNESENDELRLLELIIHDYDNRLGAGKQKAVEPVRLLKSIMSESSISQSDFAAELGVSRQIISDILNKRRSISLNMARKFGKYFAMSELAFIKEPSYKKNPENRTLIIFKKNTSSERYITKDKLQLVKEKKGKYSKKSKNK